MIADSSPAPARALPTLKYERAAKRRGASVVAGVDEVGRGPLAGPVVVAAVILDQKRVPRGIDDSKRLTPERREELFEEISRTARYAIVTAPPSVIARLNILHASLWAMRQAILALTLTPDHVLVDGHMIPRGMPCVTQAIVGGDGLSLSIAAASILAKVTRDRMCRIMHCEEPQYGFDGHKGYSAPVHLKALTEHGPGRHHRMDFAPCAEAARVRTGGLTSHSPSRLIRL